MNPEQERYRIWACDNQVYGPIDLPRLLEWVRDGRVLGNTWIYLESIDQWCPANRHDPLQPHLLPGDETNFLHERASLGEGVDPTELRQFNALASLSNHELAHLIQHGELAVYAPGELILRKGDPSDAVYFVLAGCVRIRLVVGLEDRTLATIPAGEFFGEMAMFTGSPRSADAVADGELRLMRMSAEAFNQLIQRNPAAAAPLLCAIARTMAKRIVDDNQRLQKEIAAEFVWR